MESLNDKMNEKTIVLKKWRVNDERRRGRRRNENEGLERDEHNRKKDMIDFGKMYFTEYYVE